MAFVGEAHDLVGIVFFLEATRHAVRAEETDVEELDLPVRDQAVGRAVEEEGRGGRVVAVVQSAAGEDGSRECDDAGVAEAVGQVLLQRTKLIYSELLILTPLKTGGVGLRKLLTLRCVRCSAGEAARGPDEKALTKRSERKGPAGKSPDHLAYAVGICLNVFEACDEESTPKTGNTTQKTTQKPIGETAQRILDLLTEDPYLTRQALAPILDLTPDGVKYHLNKLQRDGYLERKEGRKTGRWKVLIKK